MGSDTRTGGPSGIPEDTVDLGNELDPTRTLLSRASAGDRSAAAALVDVLGPRIHGLAVHVTDSSATAGRLTVSVLRSCLRDAADLAASALPGEAAVLHRARRAAVATRPRGDVRSLIAPDATLDRTSDRREVEVVRTLLELPSAQRALVESAAQGRFDATGPQRGEAAGVLARVLDQLVAFGGPQDPDLRALAALDALALAGEQERHRLRELTVDPGTAGVHRHALEAAASLTLLTAVPPSRDLHLAVLEGFGAAPEALYHGTYSTPVLGTDSQRRMVGPPAVAGAVHSAATPVSSSPSADVPQGETGPAPSPAFAFRAVDEKRSSRHERRKGRPWISRSLAVLALIGVLVLGGLLIDARRERAASEAFASTWAQYSVAADAELIDGLSDNGDWAAVITPDGLAVRAEGVVAYEGEVLQLWGTSDGARTDLGVLEMSRDGLLRFTSPETADSLVVTREMAPQNVSGTPSSRIVASLDPALSDTRAAG
ncbi:hypothetical protein [Brachybacterium sacelli]|uniref:Uncharacterized protein n=1 Tax=Brachybacterium sacelli TaxID=173364 RepID=A0ABS4X1D8_9MICO|nr:hypothetical protein [Brachybacterium sacelli]MBP2382262.1 hypothetical protein [Brachybacterium sacelli]